MSDESMASLVEATHAMGAAMRDAGHKATVAMRAFQGVLPPAVRELPEETLRHIDALIGEDDVEVDPAAVNAAIESDAWEFVDAASWSTATS